MLLVAVLILILIALIIYYYQSSQVSKMTLDQSLKQSETSQDWHADSHIKDIMAPFTYEDTDTTDYFKYFSKYADSSSDVLEYHNNELNDNYESAKKAKFTFTPDHLEQVGSTTYNDEYDINATNYTTN